MGTLIGLLLVLWAFSWWRSNWKHRQLAEALNLGHNLPACCHQCLGYHFNGNICVGSFSGLNFYTFFSMFVFLSMLVLGMSEHAIGNYVLAGPRTPYWGCKRGCDGNYASRIKCRCGAAAPTTIMQKANRNAPTDAPKLTEHSNSFIFNLFQSTWTTKTRTGGPRKESSF